MKNKAAAVFAVLFGLLAVCAWVNRPPNINSPEFWKGAPNITYRQQAPVPVPSPEAFFAQFQPVSVDGKEIQTALVIKPMGNTIEAQEQRYLLAAQRKEKPPGAPIKRPPKVAAQRKEHPDCWPWNCEALDKKWIVARVAGYRME